MKNNQFEEQELRNAFNALRRELPDDGFGQRVKQALPIRESGRAYLLLLRFLALFLYGVAGLLFTWGGLYAFLCDAFLGCVARLSAVDFTFTPQLYLLFLTLSASMLMGAFFWARRTDY